MQTLLDFFHPFLLHTFLLLLIIHNVTWSLICPEVRCIMLCAPIFKRNDLLITRYINHDRRQKKSKKKYSFYVAPFQNCAVLITIDSETTGLMHLNRIILFENWRAHSTSCVLLFNLIYVSWLFLNSHRGSKALCGAGMPFACVVSRCSDSLSNGRQVMPGARENSVVLLMFSTHSTQLSLWAHRQCLRCASSCGRLRMSHKGKNKLSAWLPFCEYLHTMLPNTRTSHIVSEAKHCRRNILWMISKMPDIKTLR